MFYYLFCTVYIRKLCFISYSYLFKYIDFLRKKIFRLLHSLCMNDGILNSMTIFMIFWRNSINQDHFIRFLYRNIRNTFYIRTKNDQITDFPDL